jgi:hypothetical protein
MYQLFGKTGTVVYTCRWASNTHLQIHIHIKRVGYGEKFFYPLETGRLWVISPTKRIRGGYHLFYPLISAVVARAASAVCAPVSNCSASAYLCHPAARGREHCGCATGDRLALSNCGAAGAHVGTAGHGNGRAVGGEPDRRHRGVRVLAAPCGAGSRHGCRRRIGGGCSSRWSRSPTWWWPRTGAATSRRWARQWRRRPTTASRGSEST